MRKPKGLSAEDQELWALFTQAIAPLRRKSPPAPAALPEKPAPAPDPVKTATRRKAADVPPPAPLPAHKAPPPDAHQKSLDRSTLRKVTRGAMEIEAKLDLHGYSQDRAYAALAAFIERCLAREKRCVLVITGKGKGGEGILKTNLRRWLAEPRFLPHILAVSEAQAQHGGGGAFYLLLRRRR